MFEHAFRHIAPAGKQRGFTLVELITIMVIVGILGAIGFARYMDRASFDAAAYTEQVRALLRYGQKVAVAQNRDVFVRLNGSSVALCFNFATDATCGAPNRVRPASGSNSGASTTLTRCASANDWACEGNPRGIAYSSVPNIAYFSFNALGRPFAAGDGALNSTFQKLTLSVTGDGTTRSVVVEAESGHVH